MSAWLCSGGMRSAQSPLRADISSSLCAGVLWGIKTLPVPRGAKRIYHQSTTQAAALSLAPISAAKPASKLARQSAPADAAGAKQGDLKRGANYNYDDNNSSSFAATAVPVGGPLPCSLLALFICMFCWFLRGLDEGGTYCASPFIFSISAPRPAELIFSRHSVE